MTLYFHIFLRKSVYEVKPICLFVSMTLLLALILYPNFQKNHKSKSKPSTVAIKDFFHLLLGIWDSEAALMK